MHPAHLPAIKQVILKTSIPELQTLVKKILNTYDPEKLTALIERLNQ